MPDKEEEENQIKKEEFPYEYKPHLRKKSKIYSKNRLIVGLVNGFLLPSLFLALFLISVASAMVRDFATTLSDNFYIQVAIYGIIFFSFVTFIDLPASFYMGYIYEHKYGLSNQTAKSWFVDFFKSLILLYAFSIPALLIFYYLLSNFQFWWVFAGIVALIFSVIVTAVVPVVLIPIFYKVEPYSDEEHKRHLKEMAKKAGVSNIEKILVVRESAKSKKANAAFAGLGKTKRILLFDTLLEKFTRDEIEAAVAHELGHYAHKDLIKGLILDGVTIFPSLFAIDYILRSSVGLWGIHAVYDIAAFPLILLSSLLINFAISPISNAISRKFEMDADTFSLDMTNNPLAEISLEKRLADLDLEDTSPKPIVEFLFYSHPSVEKRIRNVYKWMDIHNYRTSRDSKDFRGLPY
ncbi:MAG: M48 family metallopeptidase [Thermoplasmata archaeon]